MNKKNVNGITLIALVITIIVLLILAGVSIAMLTGPNGLLTQADEARTETDMAGAREKVQIEVLGSYGIDGNIDLDKLNQNLLNISDIKKYKDGISTKLTNENPIEELPADVVVDGYIFEISKEGVVTQKNGDISEPTVPTEVLAESIQVEDLVIEEDIKTGKLTVTTTPNEITENLIYTSKNTEIITVDSEGNVIAKKEGTAQVEVQGEKSGVKGECTVIVKFRVGEIVTGSNKTYTDIDGDSAVIPVGFAIVPKLNNVSEGLVISDKENDTEDKGNQFVWIPVENEENYKEKEEYLSGIPLETITPDKNYLPIEEENLNGKSEQEVEKDLVITDLEKKYKVKGFYISRYEAGKENTNILVSKKGANVLVDISQDTAKSTAKTFGVKDNEKVKSGLCTGIQWDMVMKFVNGNDDGEGNQYLVETSSSTRHKGSSVGVQQSGQNLADKVCNIYDLEGNCYEYVAEKTTWDPAYPYVVRGGRYDVNKPASARGNCSGNTVSSYSFRFVLYVM